MQISSRLKRETLLGSAKNNNIKAYAKRTSHEMPKAHGSTRGRRKSSLGKSGKAFWAPPKMHMLLLFVLSGAPKVSRFCRELLAFHGLLFLHMLLLFVLSGAQKVSRFCRELLAFHGLFVFAYAFIVCFKRSPKGFLAYAVSFWHFMACCFCICFYCLF